jgi:hypothetical protein
MSERGREGERERGREGERERGRESERFVLRFVFQLLFLSLSSSLFCSSGNTLNVIRYVTPVVQRRGKQADRQTGRRTDGQAQTYSNSPVERRVWQQRETLKSTEKEKEQKRKEKKGEERQRGRTVK